MFYKIEICDKQEILLDQYVFNNKKAFERKYNELKNKYYYSAVMYVFIGDNMENLTELKDKRVYYNGLYEVQKPKITVRKAPILILLYILLTPIAVLIKLGRDKA